MRLFAPERVAGMALSFAQVAFVALLGCSTSSTQEEAPSASPEQQRGDGEDEVGPGDPSAPSLKGALEVHEWGTFTSMNGAAGVSLDGLHHEEEALPSFVHSNTGSAYPSPFRAYGDASMDRPIRRVNSKMETPVIYFYPNQKMRAEVRVDYEGGLITQWFPAASRATPSAAGSALSPLDIGRIERSSFEWELDLTPAGAGKAPSIPTVDARHPWHFAREVQAAYVTAAGPSSPPREAGALPEPDESERYVFYRGLGKMRPVVRARPLNGEHVLLENATSAAIPAMFVLEMKESAGRFVTIGPRAAGASEVARIEAAPRAKEAVVEALSREVEAALVAEGLFADEARAMVRTWAPTWFASEGTRVLSIVPRAVTDAVLPITITPAPDKLVRVLVARTELLMPETEARVEQALLDRSSPSAPARERAMKQLARLGRFLEPAVRSVIGKPDAAAAVKKSGAEVLASFR